MPDQEYLTVSETAAFLKLAPKTVRKKMGDGTFKKRTHYFTPRGLRPRFKKSALVAWLEGTEDFVSKNRDGIPMVKGYIMGEPRTYGD